MAFAIVTVLAEAVKDLLQTRSDNSELSEAVTVMRVNVPIDEVTAAGETVVVVFPGGRSTTAGGRDSDERDYETRIAILERLVSDEDDAVTALARQDALIALSESVEQVLERSRFDLGGVAEAVWNSNGTGDVAAIFPSHIETRNQYTAVLSCLHTVIF